MRTQPIIASVLSLASSVWANPSPPHQPKTHLNYTVVTGIFQQDDPATDPSTFNFTAQNFGLINRTYPSDSSCPDRGKATQWQKLNHYIDTLNHSPETKKNNERYVLLFLGRHGEGFHNAAESYFGTPAWNCYWSELDGNGTVTWADAHLTTTGIAQADVVNRFWNSLLTKEKIAAPESYYTSPLYRCLATADLTFANLPLPRKNPFVPTVKELFREGISAHTCDRRSNRTYIASHFPTFKFEKGFPEHDPYWKELMAEPREEQDRRSKVVLDDVFSSDKNTYISVTSHSGEIASLLRVLGHRVFGLSTGAALPVLVKATTLKGETPPTSTIPYNPQATCAMPPTIRNSTCNDCSCCL
ncbi:phosphoglycerate mutase-like protein [Periconia macrospinosa]|uniref:Phosphoglycerate mutase-like protein n=1 Tax=Periconia macrospinosa TaxID=97972 RepID=A0A2V1DWP6_9PLEO|nr:phosphoglycerate mutase-like protein [Periconia macrospinosa]